MPVYISLMQQGRESVAERMSNTDMIRQLFICMILKKVLQV